MKIGHIWQGVSNPQIFKQWNDGLRQALRILSEEYDVAFFEPWDDTSGMDVLFYHEAPCTINGLDAGNYKRVQSLPQKKILLFAGGQMESVWVEGFDLVCVESAINEDECRMQSIPFKRAFGINDTIFKPLGLQKKYDGMHHGTCASWKRQELLAKALCEKAVVCGREQKSDPLPFMECEKYEVNMFPELPAEEVNILLNESLCLVQTSAFWGGGQRATLEAMSAGIPVICMSDSPKNMEFVQESGAGIVVSPDIESIRNAIEEIRLWTNEKKQSGIQYVTMKWTAKHYAQALKEAIKSL